MSSPHRHPVTSLRFLAAVAALVLLPAVPPARAGTAKPATPHAAEPRQLWSAKLPGAAKWQQVTSLGSLLVGTDSTLMCFNPDTGELLWKSDQFRKTTPQNVKEIAGTPYLIANDQEGLVGIKTNLVALDYLTGQELWRLPEMLGQYLGTIPVVEKNLVLLLFSGAEGKETGTFLHAFDLNTGEKKWCTKYAKSGAVPMHIADNSSMFAPRLDLSGHQDPLVAGDRIYLPFLGVHCFDLNSGQLLWGVPFDAADKVNKRAYPALRLVDGKIYGGGSGEIYCLDAASGALVWKSSRVAQSGLKAWKDAVLSQVEVLGDKVFVRMGGNYSDGKQVVLKKPLGVLALDRASGRELWRSKDIDNGITNLLPAPAHNLILCADGDSLLGIDATAPGYVEKFKVKIEFKRKMGGGDVAKIGLGALGGLTGIAKGAMSQSKARLDVPVALLDAQGKVGVSGRQHLLLFDPAKGAIEWSLYYAAPGEGFGGAAMFAITALAAAGGNLQAAASGGIGSSGYRDGVSNIHSSLDRYNRYSEKAAQRAKSRSNEQYTYILTRVDKEIGIVGVNLGSGETDRQVVLKEKEPMYLADEEAGRLFHFKGKSSVICYQF